MIQDECLSTERIQISDNLTYPPSQAWVPLQSWDIHVMPRPHLVIYLRIWVMIDLRAWDSCTSTVSAPSTLQRTILRFWAAQRRLWMRGHIVVPLVWRINNINLSPTNTNYNVVSLISISRTAQPRIFFASMEKPGVWWFWFCFCAYMHCKGWMEYMDGGCSCPLDIDLACLWICERLSRIVTARMERDGWEVKGKERN
jgi:hypothetical protein